MQNRGITKSVIFLTLIGVAVKWPAITYAVVQPQLSDVQKAELSVATKLKNQSLKLYKEGKYQQAAKIAQQAVSAYERILGPEDPDTAEALNLLAVIHSVQGNNEAAARVMERALKIFEITYGTDDRLIATCLNNLADMYSAQAKYSAAEPLIVRGLKIREKVLGAEHPDTAASLNSLAKLHQSRANDAAAEPLFRRALEIREKVLGSERRETAISLNNLALLYRSQGNYAAAEPLLLRALKIREKVYGPEHPGTASGLNNLAVLYRAKRDFASAEPLLLRALKIREATLGPDHPGTAMTLNNLASVYRAQGNDAAVEPLYLRAVAIREKALGPDHPDTAASLADLAVHYQSQGNNVAAEPLLLRALRIKRAVLGPEHPDTAIVLNNLALLYASEGNIHQAMSFIDEERKGQRTHVSRVLPALSAAAQEMYLSSNFTTSFHIALSLALSHASGPDDVALSAEWLINGKGVAQDARAQRNLLLRDVADPKLAPVVDKLLSIRTQLSALVMNAAEVGKADQRRNSISQLTAVEQRLAGQLGGRTSDSIAEWVDVARIRKAIPTDSVLIDIARFDVFDFVETVQQDKWQAAHYVAWVTAATGQADTVLIDLGAASAIDELVERVREQIAADSTDDGNIAKDGEEQAAKKLANDLAALAKLIWLPLAEHVGDAKNIILSPDGALWLAPWSALPVDESGDQYLLERYNLRMIVSGRDLVTKPDGRAARPPVILANPEFDQLESQKKSAIKGIFNTLPAEDDNATRSFSAKGTLPKVKPLPNTGIEAIAIQPHIETYTGKKVGLYKQQYALERVAKALHGPQIATFATHGFFLPKQETKLEDRNSLMADDSRAVVLDIEGKPIENPLLRCGLLLSGCNNRTATVGNDDGILTGMEIVGIDFRGTELVVLSACETGVGDVRNGEGVAGLRQAFQLAGAEAVMATLWQIPDRESAILMSSFFEHLANGQSKAEALRSAQLELIEKRRSRYGAAHPFYWAAFTLTGK